MPHTQNKLINYNYMKKLLLLLALLGFGITNSYTQNKSNCTLWQLPAQDNYVGTSYVFLMDNGKVAVMDGGMKEEAWYLKGFLAALGNEVEAWFISHPHPDHIGALNEILKAPGNLKIKNVYHSEFPSQYLEKFNTKYDSLTREFYGNLQKSGINVVNFTSPGEVIQIDKTKFKILTVTSNDITLENFYNDNSMVIKAWDEKKSFLFLADLWENGGDRLMDSPFKDDLDCDYLQVAHHGQKGVKLDFYRSIKFRACLWPAPLWLYDNDRGKGFNTAHYKTVETRELMDELGIKEHYVSCNGLVKIE